MTMKTMMTNVKALVALLMVGAAVASCSSDDADAIADQSVPQPAGPQVYTMTVNASKGGDETRALALDGNTLNATWATTENVYVKKGEAWAEGSLQPQAAGTSTTLKGTLSDIEIANGDELALQFPRSGALDYTGQVGTLEDIAARYDYATATVTVASVSGGNVTTTAAANFQNQQAVVKFTLVDKADGTTPLSATQLTVSDGTNNYAVTPASGTSEIYVAIPGFTEKAITLTATVGSDTYSYEKTGVTFANGKYYAITVKMTKQASVPNGAISGKFTIDSSGKQVYFSKGNLQYQASTDTWRFAEHQWDYVGDAAGNTTDASDRETQSDWIDLFGYGTGHDPTLSSDEEREYLSYQVLWEENSDLQSRLGTGWKTPSRAEWEYVIKTRTTGGTVFGTAPARYTEATINTDGTGVNGIILFPDGVDIAASEVTTAGTVNSTSEWGTKCTAAQWAALEAKGCVFLPAAGFRDETYVKYDGSDGYYWSSTGGNYGYYLYFSSRSMLPSEENDLHYGHSVRLVYDVK